MVKVIRITVLIVIPIVCLISFAANPGMTTKDEITVFVINNIDVIKSGDTAQILALSDELTLFDPPSEEYTAFICGTLGFGPDGTYYGFYISFDDMPHEMTGCNAYRTSGIAENIYYFEYTVY